MRLIRFRHGDGEPRVGVLLEEGVIATSELDYPSTIEGLLAAPPDTINQLASALAVDTRPRQSLSDVRLEAPIPSPSKLIAIGVNYLDHCREQGIELPQEPLAFSKYPSAIIGTQDAITWNPTHAAAPAATTALG
jgi:2-keto-4-pentenoate hydratase/2-oxohepta-3-ene-1,7-dioic acid hydratase in catechol pathway